MSCFPVSSPHPSLHHLDLIFQLLLQFVYSIPTSHICPTCLYHPSLYTIPPSPQLCFPCALTRLAIIAEENSLDLKISMSVSVLLPWRVPQGCAVLWMALSVRLVWGSIHTHHRPTHTLSKGHSKAVITSILRLCYYCYPPSSQRGLGPFLRVHSSKSKAHRPSSIKVPSPIT